MGHGYVLGNSIIVFASDAKFFDQYPRKRINEIRQQDPNLLWPELFDYSNFGARWGFIQLGGRGARTVQFVPID